MRIPTKIQHGDKVISTVYAKINGIIDYLNASRVRSGTGIRVQETPSGTVVSSVPKTVTPPQLQPVATSSGLTATVSDGMATVAISGSTALVIEPGANIQISGGTNGELIISATGGGGGTAAVFPDLSNPVETIDFDVPHAAYAFPVWLIGNIGIESSSVGNDIACSVIVNGYETSVYQWTSSTPPNGTLLVPFSFLIPPNNPFEISTLVSGSTTDLRGSVTAYHCTGQTPLADYTVTRATGTTNGSLFYGLSQQGDNTVSVDPSLNGTPIDFEGASVL